MSFTPSELRQQKANEGIADFEKWEGRRRFYVFEENRPLPKSQWQLRYFFLGNRQDKEGRALLAESQKGERDGLAQLYSIL